MDLLGNVASRVWNTVVLQELSDLALPAGKGQNASLPQFNAYADLLERYVHDGAAQSFTEAQLFGSLGACTIITGGTAGCNIVHNIPQNQNASAMTGVYVTQTWARPDMVFPHKVTRPDPTTPDGCPIVVTSGMNAILYYPTLAAMTAAQSAVRAHRPGRRRVPARGRPSISSRPGASTTPTASSCRTSRAIR